MTTSVAPGPLVASPLSRRRARVATGAVIAVMAAVNIGGHFLRISTLWLGPAAALALLVFARRTGLTWAQLGFARDRLRSGAKWGAIAIGTVSAVYVAGVALPQSRSAFLDARYHLGVSGALTSAFIVIPLGTILFEEIAFRSVLWGMLSRHTATWRVVLISSLMFGLWHVLPSLHLASANAGVGNAVHGAGAASGVLVVAGTVCFTALGGVVAGELRRRSGSLLASVGMHWATNALGVLFGLLAWRLAT